jgi:hypothetical protein
MEGALRFGRFFALGAFAKVEFVSFSGHNGDRPDYDYRQDTWSTGGSLRGLLPLSEQWEMQAFLELGYWQITEEHQNISVDCGGMADGLAGHLGIGLNYRLLEQTWLGARGALESGNRATCTLVLHLADPSDPHISMDPPTEFWTYELALTQRW